MPARKTRSAGRRQKPSGWMCPTCHRRFPRERQAHSCKVQPSVKVRPKVQTKAPPKRQAKAQPNVQTKVQLKVHPKLQPLDAHFVDKEASLRGLFNFLVGKLGAVRPFRVDAKKTSINLVGRHQFGDIAVRGSYLRLEFSAREPILSLRIVERQELGPNRVSHLVLVARETDIDSELLGWLADAQRLH